MTVNKLVKASGKNSVTLYFTLSLPYRLNGKFSLTADGITSSDVNWIYVQDKENLTSV